jgi:transcriptional regulator with XRE-family HTH domain
MVISTAQLRAARALLGIDQRQLAELSTVSLAKIQAMEASLRELPDKAENLIKVLCALHNAGIEFIEDQAVSKSGGAGVRFSAEFDVKPFRKKETTLQGSLRIPKLRA